MPRLYVNGDGPTTLLCSWRSRASKAARRGSCPSTCSTFHRRSHCPCTRTNSARSSCPWSSSQSENTSRRSSSNGDSAMALSMGLGSGGFMLHLQHVPGQLQIDQDHLDSGNVLAQGLHRLGAVRSGRDGEAE